MEHPSESPVDNPKLQSLLESFEQVFLAVGWCLQNSFPLPALILTYSAIDTFGWLYAAEGTASVQKSFCGWVDKWLIPHPDLDCTSIDLYAARCAVLHTYTGDSVLSRRGKARRVLYSYGNMEADALRKLEKSGRDEQFVSIDIHKLVHAVRSAGARFVVTAAKDPELSEQLSNRAGKFYAHLDGDLNIKRLFGDDGEPQPGRG